ncbi:uncharacterized protein N7503_008808, partial [Penicillium pulvis]|uniref:uncharacterized protein n=1 Tax=Penicillium pulvis TaxID=1562058 RepID=UPI00254763AA
KKVRRSHRKSRLGCTNCKARKIKCDELKPICTQCLHRPGDCSFINSPSHDGVSKSMRTISTSVPSVQPAQPGDLVFISSSQSGFTVPKRARKIEEQQALQSLSSASSTASSSTPTSGSDTALFPRLFEFSAIDMALFHHCLSAEDLKNYIPDELIRLGFSSHFVMHLLLAVSGFHLNRKLGVNHISQFLGPDVDFYLEAERHLQVAIATVATAPGLTQGNSQALYVASVYIFVCSLARGLHNDEYLAFRADNDKPILCLFLGLRTIMEDCNTRGLDPEMSSVHSDIPESDATDAPPGYQGGVVETYQIHDALYEYSEPLQNLQALLSSIFPPGNLRNSSYCFVFDSLQSRYESVHGGSTSPSGAELWPLIFSWLYTLPDCVVRDMEDKQPVALLLLAFFAVLLDELDSVWFIRGWPRHIVRGVYNQLKDDHRGLIHWPLSRLGLSFLSA